MPEGPAGVPRTDDLMARILVALLLLALGAGPVAAQEEGRGGGGGRNRPPGIRLELGYAADLFQPALGGRSRDPVALDNLDLFLHLSLNPLLGLRGTSVRVHVQSNRGSSISSRVGDLQGISNLEAPTDWRLYEAWIGHQFGSPRLSLLAGVYDVNSEFDVLPGAGDFLNSSFGLGPELALAGDAGPATFPATGLALRLRYEPSPNLYALLGGSDGVPGAQSQDRFTLSSREGALVSFEVGHTLPLEEVLQTPGRVATPGRGLEGRPVMRGLSRRIGRGRQIVDVRRKVALGGWMFTRKQDPWAGDASPARSWGLYALAETRLSDAPDGIRGLSGFARIGTASEAVDRLGLSVGGGLLYRGPWASRPNDALGLGAFHARNGSPVLRASRNEGIALDRSETVVELLYRLEAGDALVLEPDLQWILNPGTDPSLDHALVFGLRLHFLLDYSGGGPGG
jgi:porin